jgi:hypothetical protein
VAGHSQALTGKAPSDRGDVSSNALAEPAVPKSAEAHGPPADAQARTLTSLAEHESGEARPQKPGPPSGKAQ